jgi:hypothetical protein
MKKVVAMASFLLVGCLPGIGVDEDEDEGDGDDVIVPVTMTIEDEYKSTAGVTYVGCAKDVTVTFPEAVELDYIVYVTMKKVVGTTTTYPYQVAATPNAARTIWTVTNYAFGDILTGEEADDCEAVCIVALLKHPCCPGEEVALRVVTIDCEKPYADLAVTFKDCFDPCAETDECNPFIGGAYFEFSSRTAGECITTDCCGDDCSGFASWTLVIDPDPCAPACDTVSGSACPVEGVVECGCLLYATTTATLTYDVTYTLLDNVGNKFEDTWTITVDTDEVTKFTGGLLSDVDVTTGTTTTTAIPLYVYTGNCL